MTAGLIIWASVLRYTHTRMLVALGSELSVHIDDNKEPFHHEFVYLFQLLSTSDKILAIALLCSTLRLAFYSSLCSTQFYSVREALFGSLGFLVPPFTFFGLTLVGFGSFAHLTFGAVSTTWNSFSSSFMNLVMMTRRPALMDLKAIEWADPLVETFGFSVIAPIFFLTYTVRSCRAFATFIYCNFPSL